MKKLIPLLAVIILLQGCQGIPKDALIMKQPTLEYRELQTRKYDGISENRIFSASTAILQDLEFNIDEAEKSLGVLVGSKNRDATDPAQVGLAITLALLGGGAMPIDSEQKIKASVVIDKIKKNKVSVRVTFQRMVWNSQGKLSKVESIQDKEVYQQFFEKLHKAVFLEKQKV